MKLLFIILTAWGVCIAQESNTIIEGSELCQGNPYNVVPVSCTQYGLCVFRTLYTFDCPQTAPIWSPENRQCRQPHFPTVEEDCQTTQNARA